MEPEYNFDEFERAFSASEKLRAFLYHLYMTTVGEWLSPAKHEEYIKVFEEFKKWRAEKENKV